MLMLALAAHATSYTETLGSMGSSSNLGPGGTRYGATLGTILEITETVDLTGIELYAKEGDSDCTSCSVSSYLWTYDSAAGTWSGSSLGATLYVNSSSSYGWETATLSSPKRLEAGTTYAIGFYTSNFIYLYLGSSSLSWATIDGYARDIYVSSPSDADMTLDSAGSSPYMRLHIDVPDDDGDGYDAFTDCNDSDPIAYPGATEVWYDGDDQACDGGSDYDQDGDGYDQDEDDCDDEDPGVNPGAWERWYDGVDQDCAGDDDYDQDRDGDPTPAGGGTDCDDEDEDFGAHAEERWYDGVDQDCRGDSDFDQDGDGHDTPSAGGDDCDDTDPATYTGAPEVWYDDVDQACDGGDDQDQDGDGLQLGEGDCDDTDPSIHPGAVESWYDGVDQDCDGGSDYDQDGDGFEAGANGATGNDCDDLDASAWDDCGGDDGDDADEEDGGEGKVGGICGTPAAVSGLWWLAAGLAWRRRVR